MVSFVGGDREKVKENEKNNGGGIREIIKKTKGTNPCKSGKKSEIDQKEAQDARRLMKDAHLIWDENAMIITRRE